MPQRPQEAGSFQEKRWLVPSLKNGFMKHCYAWIVNLAICCVQAATVADRGPNHRTWVSAVETRLPDGQTIMSTNQIIELGTGINFLKEGVWQDTEEVILPTQT